MYFQRFSPAPPSALPTNAVGNLPGERLPVPAPVIPYVQQPQFVEQPPELVEDAAIGAALAAAPVQPIGSPYAPPVQLVAATFPQAPSEPATGAADVYDDQGFYDTVPPGAVVPEPSLASPTDALVDIQAGPSVAGAVVPDLGPKLRVGPRRLRRGAAPNRTSTDWVFCLSMTLLFLLTVLAILAYFSYKKLLAMKRRGPRH